MADDGDAATAASSPASDANNDNSNNHEQEQESTVKSAKDRACPFCGQAFTSSSLGRHLDLYIKPKNPKPADGVHDVDEIRKIRGGITRRQPRNSTKGATSRRAESVETPESGNKPSRLLKENSSLVATNQSMHAVSPILAREGIYVNTPSWQSTGVINNIPPRAPSRPDADASATGQAQRVQEMRRDTSSGQPMQRPDPRMPDTQKLQEQAEIGRAAELALREVLGSLQAARRKVEPGPIYEDFDFFAQSFPGLCLNILPPPTTLFSPAPFASPESWSLKPPGQQQSEVMNRLFNERCRDLRKANPDHPTDANIFRHSAHLQGAFENWRLMSDKDQQAAWTLEALRCFTTSRDTNSKLKRRLADAEQHTTHLEAQYDRLSRCQLPRESLLRPPQTIPISSSVAREAQKHRGSGQDNEYDADAAISRWRETVRSVTRPARQSTAHLPNYAASAMNTRQTGRTITGDMIIHGSLDQGGPQPRANADLHRSEIEMNPGTVNYETPPHPGAILDDEDDHQAQTKSPQNYNYPYAPAGGGDDEDLDEDVSNVLDTSLTNFVDRNALAKQRRFVQGSFSSSNSPGSGGGGAGTFGKFRVNGGARSVDTGSPVLNSNGKRPAAPAADMGFGGVGKGQRT